MNTGALRCYDNEDVEGWLIEEGIGYRDERDLFQYGTDPREFQDYSGLPDLDNPDPDEVPGWKTKN